jgi:hypothetical protein
MRIQDMGGDLLTTCAPVCPWLAGRVHTLALHPGRGHTPSLRAHCRRVLMDGNEEGNDSPTDTSVSSLQRQRLELAGVPSKPALMNKLLWLNTKWEDILSDQPQMSGQAQ